MVGRGRASKLPGVQGPTVAPACRRPFRPRRHPLAVSLQLGGHLVPDGLWGGIHQDLLGQGCSGGRGVPQYGPRPPGSPCKGVHQGVHYRLHMGRPKRPRRTLRGGRQGLGTPRGDEYPAEALPRPQGRRRRDSRRGDCRKARPPSGWRILPGGHPDSAPTSNGALGSTPGALTLKRGAYSGRTPTRVGQGRRRCYPRSIEVGQDTQALTEANAPAYQAFVTVDKRPRRLALLSANSAGKVGPGRLPVQRLVEVQLLAEVRMRVRAWPLCNVGEAEPRQVPQHCGGQMAQYRLKAGGGVPHPRHLKNPLGSKDDRRRGGFPPSERSAKVGHYARHPGQEPEEHLHCRPPGRRWDVVRPARQGVGLGALHLRGPH